jgi:hypothetical protein
VVAGARRNGPVRPHAQRTAERRANTRARHCFLASASDPKLWPDVCAVIKLNINMAVAYIYEIWLSLAIKCMALHPTPLESLSHAHKVCTSERNWPSSWTCLFVSWCARFAFTVAQKPTLVLGVDACRGPLDARLGAKSIGLFAMQRKSDRKITSRAPVSSKLGSRIFIVLLRGKTEGWSNERQKRSYRTEHGSFSDCFHKKNCERQ